MVCVTVMQLNEWWCTCNYFNLKAFQKIIMDITDDFNDCMLDWKILKHFSNLVQEFSNSFMFGKSQFYKKIQKMSHLESWEWATQKIVQK